MDTERQSKIEAINQVPEAARTKIDKYKSVKVFIRNLLRYPLSSFKRSKYAEKMPNVFFGYSDHPLDRDATPYQYPQSFLTWNRGHKATCLLSVRLIENTEHRFIFQGKGYDIYRIVDDQVNGIQHTYRVDDKTRFQTLTLQIDFLRADTYRLRLTSEELAPENLTPMVVGDIQEGNLVCGIKEFPEYYQILTDKLRLAVFKQDFRIEVFDRDDRLIVESSSRTKDEFVNALDSFPLGFIRDSKTRQTYGVENFTLYPGEVIYGLGERFDGVDKMGKTVGHWVFEGSGNSSGRSYKPIPFFMSTQGYGVYINESRPITHWIGTRETCTHQIGIQQDFIDYYFFYGPELKHILDVYTQLTGRTSMVPKWSFGTWMSRWSYYSQEQVMQVARLLREMEIPCDVIHIDAGWFKEDWACDWTFSSDRFPDPEGMFKELREMGFRVSLWQIPYVLEQTHQYADAKRKGILAKRNGPFVWLFMFTGSPIDFSNPEGIDWYKARLKSLLQMGASAIKADFGEQIEPHMAFQKYDGMSMHNLYPLLYNRAAFEAVEETTGEGIIWARSAYAGSQRYPVHWSGDNSANYANMLTSLRAGLSFGLSGFTFWSQDTGGFGGSASDELYIRWSQLSIFQSHIRFHAPLPKYNEPWNFSEDTQEIVKEILKLRYRLIPYLFSESKKAVSTGLPLLRHLILEFQEDPTVYSIEDQFLCGSHLLVAPIMTPDNQRKVYLPAGLWYDFWTGEPLHGPVWLDIDYPLDIIPVYVRCGMILPFGPVVNHTGEIDDDEYEVRIYPDEENQAEYSLYTEKGIIGFESVTSRGELALRIQPCPTRATVWLPSSIPVTRITVNDALCNENNDIYYQ